MHGHGDKPYLCPHPECDRAQIGFGFPRQWNLKDHMRRVHHDDGTQLDRMPAAASSSAVVDSAPAAVSSSQAVSKGRKRKKDAAAAAAAAASSSSSSSSSASASSSRKSSASRGSASSSTNNRDSRDNHSDSRRQAQALAAVEAANKAALEQQTMNEWYQHKEALSTIVTGFTQPDDPDMLGHLQSAQVHFEAISRISTGMVSSGHGPYSRSFPQQLG